MGNNQLVFEAAPALHAIGPIPHHLSRSVIRDARARTHKSGCESASHRLRPKSRRDAACRDGP